MWERIKGGISKRFLAPFIIVRNTTVKFPEGGFCTGKSPILSPVLRGLYIYSNT